MLFHLRLYPSTISSRQYNNPYINHIIITKVSLDAHASDLLIRTHTKNRFNLIFKYVTSLRSTSRDKYVQVLYHCDNTRNRTICHSFCMNILKNQLP